jgi:hypothetical protein
MNFKIHRGTKEIGGSCVEVWTDTSRIVIDLGMPLVNPDQTPFDARETDNRSREELILANYNQHSTKLKTALTGIDEKNLPFKLLFATSSFMGYGLYEEGIVPLGQFKKLLK